jgi:hypothetical protein
MTAKRPVQWGGSIPPRPSLKVGIVGHGADKFTPLGEERARTLIRDLLTDADVMISGHSPVGGIDIWAEEEALDLGVELDLKIPEINQWNPDGYGYRARNLDIASESDVVHVVLADTYPDGYTGRRFSYCYHCKTDQHPKSGGCWTGHRARKAQWHTVNNA